MQERVDNVVCAEVNPGFVAPGFTGVRAETRRGRPNIPGGARRVTHWLRVVGLGVLAAVAVAVRMRAAFTLPVNSDEPQHLHVVWALTQHLVPYRDVFDNHAPLFQFLCAPLLSWLGERADIVPWMRLYMIPLYFGTLWLAWYIGQVLWDRRVATLAVILVAGAPVFFEVSAQFRPDDLWMFLALAATAAVVSPHIVRHRALIVGLLLGAVCAVSLKSVLLLGSGIASGIIVAVMQPTGGARGSVDARQLFFGLAGALMIPAALIAYLAHADALRQAFYCLVSHNIVPNLGHWHDTSARYLFVLIGWPVCILIAWCFRLDAHNNEHLASRTWLLLAAAFYMCSLYGFWPLVTHQDLLPVVPIFGIGVAAALTAPWRRTPIRFVKGLIALTIVLAGAQNVVAIAMATPDQLIDEEAQLARILTLTRSTDLVMDAKGRSIFRRRPIYWVLEGVTEERMKDGLIHDDIVTELASTGTPLVLTERMPPLDADFVAKHYLCIGQGIYMAGILLPPVTHGHQVSIDIGVPTNYQLVSLNGVAAGQIDGDVGSAQPFLSAGRHVVAWSGAEPRALMWSPALERGLAPTDIFSNAAGSCRYNSRNTGP